MASELKPEQLKDTSNFALVRVLRHDEIIQFVLDQVRRLRWPMVFFYGFNIFLLIRIITFSVSNIFNSYISWDQYLLYMLFGIISGMLVVIPFHELLHGLAYRLAGARKIKYGADLKQLLFYASAPGFVTGKNAFYFIAFSPFVILNLVFLSGILYGSQPVQWGSLIALFVHTTMCIGDFAMVNFFAAYSGQKLYTYDEEKTGMSFFYLKTGHHRYFEKIEENNETD